MKGLTFAQWAAKKMASVDFADGVAEARAEIDLVDRVARRFEAEKNAPSVPLPSDEWTPTNPALWDKVLEVAQGKRQEFSQGERTIHAPNDGRGFQPWPNPNGSAWAVKQYNGFNGNWKKKTEARDVTAEKLTKGWLMGVRRGWIALLKSSHQDWADIMRTFDRLAKAVNNLEDQVLFVRRGPYTSPETMSDGQKLRALIKDLREGISDAKASAKHWQDAYEGRGLPGMQPNAREDGEKMLALYRTKFDEATEVWIKEKRFSLLDLMDRVLKLLREDAARIEKDEASGVPYEKADQPVYKEFDLHGMKVVVDDRRVTPRDIEQYIKYLDEAYQRMRQKGVAKAWYGTVFIECESCGGVNYNTGGGVGGHYVIQKDTVSIFSRPSAFIVELMAHELGHRFWFKQMTQSQRARFESFVKVRPSARRPQKPQPRLIDDSEVRAGKAAVSDVESSLRRVLADFKQTAVRAKKWKPVVDKFMEPLFSAGNTFANDMVSAMHKGGGNASATPEVQRLFQDALGAADKVRQFMFDTADESWWNKKLLEEPDPAERPANVDTFWVNVFKKNVALWLVEASEVIDAAVAAAHIYVDQSVAETNRVETEKAENVVREWDEQYENDNRPVKPVSDYGGSNIDEAFAEVFAHYVLGEDLDRDQLESFKSVLKNASSLNRSAFANREWTFLERMHLGAVLTTREGTEDDSDMRGLQNRGLVRLAAVDSAKNRLWDITLKGASVVTAGLGDELSGRMNAILTSYDPAKAKELGEWIEANFRVNSPKTPKGGKELKEKLTRLVWVLKFRVGFSTDAEAIEKARAEVAADWAAVSPHLDKVVSGFTDEGGKVVPKELNLDDRIYINEAGLDEATLNKFAKRLEALWDSVKGWRRKALAGTMKVVLASPHSFHGTAGGKYKSNEDRMLVRATPSVLKRAEGYGSFDYILIHELGHRYEFRVRGLPEDFDKVEWQTTRYSRNEGEAFAELFALGHYNLTGPWDQAVVERFEKVMG